MSEGLGLGPVGVIVAEMPPWAIDADTDGFVAAIDCDNDNPYTFPGAPEVLDRLDNQCPGDEGYGQIDEGMEVTRLVFIDSAPGATQVFCWDQIDGITGYEVAEASVPWFVGSCGQQLVPPTVCRTTGTVPRGEIRFYLVHAFGCFPNCVGGTWGRNSAGTSRTVPCSQYPSP